MLLLRSAESAGAVAARPLSGPLSAGQQFELALTLCGEAAGSEVSAVDATMPKHGHGMNYQARVLPGDGPGLYLAESMLIHMAGQWLLSVDTRRDGRRVRYTLEVMVSP